MSDGQPIGVMRTKGKREDYLTFKIGMPLHSIETVLGQLSKSEQYLLCNELKNEWAKQDIPVSGQIPGGLEIRRFVPISELTETKFVDTMNKIHSEAYIVDSSISIGLSRRIKDLVPVPHRTRELTAEDIAEITKLLSAIRPPLRVVIEGSHDPESIKAGSRIGSLFRSTGHEVKAANVVGDKADVPAGSIAIYPMDNPPDNLLVALNAMCSKLNKHILYRQKLAGGYTQILIGPP